MAHKTRTPEQNAARRAEYAKGKKAGLTAQQARAARRNTESKRTSERVRRQRLAVDRYPAPPGKGGKAKKPPDFKGGGQFENENERLENFRQWSDSKSGGFPPNILRRIREINRRAGKVRGDHYGFRYFYWGYVYGLDDKQIRKQLQDNDS